MSVAVYIALWLLAALASLGGLTVVWIPCVVAASVIVVRFELLALLGLLARVPPDSSHASTASARAS